MTSVCRQTVENEKSDYQPFTVGHLNINRLLHKIHFVQSIINEHKFSILALSETWLTEDISDEEISLPEYRVLRRDRPGRTGGGVCIYIHYSINYQICQKVQNHFLEMIWVQIRMKRETIHVDCLYRPPSEKVQYWSSLEECIENLEGTKVILMGDLNVDTLNTSDPNFQHIQSICNLHQLKNVINAPTRISPTSSKCLDIILTNMVSFNNGYTKHLHFSDHALVFAKSTMPGNNIHVEPMISSRRCWPENPMIQFRSAVENQLSSLSATGLDSMWQEWHAKFTYAVDVTAPVVYKKCSRKRRRCPWMTPELLTVLHKQKSMYRRVIRSNRQDVYAVNEHRRLRNQFQNMYRQQKNIHFNSRLLEYRKSPRLFWNTINSITGRRQFRLPPSVSVTDLADHFQRLLTTSSDVGTKPAVVPMGPYSDCSLHSFRTVTSRTVERLLKNLVLGKAAGPDGIGSTELKLAAPVIAPSLAILFNASLSSGEVPTAFKSATICPLLKPGKQNSSKPENYRGISLTPIVSKILERVVYDEVNDYLLQRRALGEHQFGFRKNHSCPDLLLSLTDDLLVARDEKKFTVAVFIDLSKAFDNVQHQELLLVLQKNGIGGTALDWFENYLKNRQQRVVSNSSSSPVFMSNKGVPQGSVLGPLLFNLYVSDLSSKAELLGAKLPSFADDMTLYSSSTSLSAACESVGRSLAVVVDALTSRGLAVNLEKTVAMIFPPSPRADDVGLSALHLHGMKIRVVSSTRVLGVILDDKLSWLPHVEQLQKKIARKIGALRRSSRQLTPTARRQFLLSVIQPDFDYASSSTVPVMTTTLQNRLTSLWRKAVRAAAGARNDESFSSILNQMRLSTISRRWTVNSLITIRRCVMGTAPVLLCKKIQQHSHRKATRGHSQGDLLPMRPRTLSGMRSFSNRSPLLWNALPAELRSASSLSSFKSKILNLKDSDFSRLSRLALGETVM